MPIRSLGPASASHVLRNRSAASRSTACLLAQVGQAGIAMLPEWSSTRVTAVPKGMMGLPSGAVAHTDAAPSAARWFTTV